MDKTRLAEWFAAGHPALLGYARRLVSISVGGYADAEDILQDALVSAMNKGTAAGFETSAEFLHWMQRVMRNRATELRRRCGGRARPLPTDGYENADQAEHGPGKHGLAAEQDTTFSVPVNASQLRGTLQALFDVLLPLSRDERFAFIMRDVLHLDWETISATLRRSQTGTKSLLWRARKRISMAAIGALPRP